MEDKNYQQYKRAAIMEAVNLLSVAHTKESIMAYMNGQEAEETIREEYEEGMDSSSAAYCLYMMF